MTLERRTCPRGCGSLATRESRGIEVDLCGECGGIWLDYGEFDPLIAERFAGEPLEAYFALTAEETSSPLRCPHEGEEMYLVPFDGMELDWCPQCHGIWIDGGERAELGRRESVASAPSAEEGRGKSTAGTDRTENAARDPGIGRASTSGDADFDESLMPQGDRVIDFASAPELELGSSGGKEPQESHPGLREIEFEGSGPTDIELDLTPIQPDDKDDLVDCASCGEFLPRARTMRMMDAYWCEVCVVEGNYPGSNGPPVARRVADAAQAMSQARVRLDEKREANKAMEELRKHRSGGSRRLHSHTQNVEVGVRAAARTLKSLFFGDK